MDKIEKIDKDRIREIASANGFVEVVITKDYYATIILYLLKDIKEIYFKGGTALQKIFLNYSRLSEDVDYTTTRDVNELKKEIIDKIMSQDYFDKVTEDKNVEGFLRLVFHYTNFENKPDTVFVDLNKRAKLVTKPEEYEIHHFYQEEMPNFSIKTLSQNEIFAEKMAAAIGRNKPRDHFDIYMIIKNGFKFDINLVKKKCEQSEAEFNIVKMFNRAKKLHNKWEEDMIPLLAKEITFKEVIQTLADYFNLKQEKDKLKDNK